MAEASWRNYERAVQDIFQRNPHSTVQCDAVVEGRSGRNRKLELLIEYPFEIHFAEGFTAQVPIRIAVDCKRRAKKVGIKTVEEFAGQMDDVSAPVGIMVALNGFDAGADARAHQLNIYLINTPWDLLNLAKGIGDPPQFHECSACSEARAEKDCLGGMVDWSFPNSQHHVAWGFCDWCNAAHAMCPDCGEITGFCEADYDEWIKCTGECERVYRVSYDVHEAGYDLESISGLQHEILREASRTGTLATADLEAIISRSKWRYWKSGEYNPLSDLENKGWVMNVDAGVILQELALELVQVELPNAREAHYW